MPARVASDLLRIDRILWGASDPFGTVDVGRRARSLMPDARLEVVGVGHLPWLDDPSRCGRLASEFLA